jgi:translation initiation factor 5
MANVNINRNLSDQFYRYKMPKLVAKVEGKGNGIKTVIVNMPEIAKSLNRPPMYPTKYFGCLLGAQVNFDNKSERYIVNGAHDSNKLQDLLDGFIQKYVLCQSCENPETILSVNQEKEIIVTNCVACGHSGTIPTANDRVAAYILKNPPPKPQAAAAPTIVATAGPTANNDDDDDARDEPDDLDSDDLNEIDYGDDDESSSDHNIALSDHDEVDDDEDEDGTEGGEQQDEEDNMDDSDQGKDAGDKSAASDKGAAERCRYWPACNAGNSCNFYHPTKPCRNFPKCLFGDKCLYIHPPCKFNQNCARSDCPFAHPAVLTAPVAKRRPPANHHFGAVKHHTATPTTPKCKYGFKCSNLECRFSHEATEPCRYGANCLLETCPFTHPTDLPRKKPASVFKWNAQS